MTAFVIESWIWYGVTMSMVLLRMLARILHLKFISRLQFEDWFMLWISILYTIFMVFINIAAVTSSNLINPADIPNLTPQDIQDRMFGSKAILVVEQCMCAVQWGTKVCLLLLYWRLTENLVDTILIKGTTIYVGVTYVVMEVLYFAVWCRPFHDYWETPTDNVQCTTALHHLIVNLVFNLTSDLLIMSIPLPLVLRAHLELKRKILLILPFTLGFFSIICAILSKHLSFTQPFSAEWVYWYVREASTVMIVSNMPYTWGLVRRVFNVRSFFGGSSQGHSRANSFGLERTASTGMEMVGGQVRELRGVSIAHEAPGLTTLENPKPPSKTERRHSAASKLFRLDSWKRRGEKGMEQLPSAAPSRDGPSAAPPDSTFAQAQWDQLNNDKSGIAVKIDLPSSSSSSAAPSDGRPSMASVTTEVRSPTSRFNADAVDRLYRLEDGDLAVDIQKERKRSDAREVG